MEQGWLWQGSVSTSHRWPVCPGRHSQWKALAREWQAAVPVGWQGRSRHSSTSPSQRSPTKPEGQAQWKPPGLGVQVPWLWQGWD